MSWQSRRYAPAPGQRLCTLENVPEGGCIELRYGAGEGAFSLLLYRSGADVNVYVNCCPHFSLPLNARPGEFLLLGKARIMCAYHCAIFRLEDGHCIDGPAVGMGLDRVPVEIRDGYIFVVAPT
jgi:nitrite reductase/ring-hydroxylating ferredoxin subunit